MRVRFWGVRGSIAVSGPRYAATGGCTSCVEVEHDGFRLVLDGGTGLRALGESLGQDPVKLAVLFSHYHWDHIQGVPFFTPAFNPLSDITLAGPRSSDGQGVRELLAHQMQAPTFPIGLETLVGARRFLDVEPGGSATFGPFRVTSAHLPHPNGVVAFRIEANGLSVVYATDNEHGLGGQIHQGLIDLARDTDLLIHDAQYHAEEYEGKRGPSRRGWGHSTWQEAVAAARQAGAMRLALYHHDPTRDDAALGEIEAAAQSLFADSFAAREGQTLKL